MDPFSFEKLPEVIRTLFEKVEHIEELLESLQPRESDDNELLTTQEAAEFLKVTVSALYTKVSRHEVPVNKPGKRLYFYKSDLKKWIIASRKKTVMEISKEAEDRIKTLDKHKNFV
ncbi:helix-turn-helix domain-containing protein [Pedobacter antarcticus]|uniref:helix-turn-helix domain-containing protein n=1 Tax=Pedobacter antarcticus TaxID=34086 RepID=UPI00292ED983|nr:helix-turn-helix domain-containing protein [Pedobacter antarcticus]